MHLILKKGFLKSVTKALRLRPPVLTFILLNMKSFERFSTAKLTWNTEIWDTNYETHKMKTNTPFEVLVKECKRIKDEIINAVQKDKEKLWRKWNNLISRIMFNLNFFNCQRQKLSPPCHRALTKRILIIDYNLKKKLENDRNEKWLEIKCSLLTFQQEV